MPTFPLARDDARHAALTICLFGSEAIMRAAKSSAIASVVVAALTSRRDVVMLEPRAGIAASAVGGLPGAAQASRAETSRRTEWGMCWGFGGGARLVVSTGWPSTSGARRGWALMGSLSICGMSLVLGVDGKRDFHCVFDAQRALTPGIDPHFLIGILRSEE